MSRQPQEGAMLYLIGVLCMSAGFGFGWAVRARLRDDVRVISFDPEARRRTRERMREIRDLAVDNDAIDWHGAA